MSPLRLRAHLDSRRLWVVLPYAIIAAVAIIALVTYSRESNDRARHRAAVEAQYIQCIDSIPLTRKINRFINGVETVGAVLLLNSVQMHAVTPPDSPAYAQQEINIRRLRRALNDQRVVTAFPVPTPASCRATSQHAG